MFACLFWLWLCATHDVVGPPLQNPEGDAIVSLAPGLTEVLFALGVGANVVGVTRYDDFPPEVRLLKKVGGVMDPDAEAIAALKPRLIVAVQAGAHTARLRSLQRPGVTVALLPTQSMEDLWETIDTLGQVLHCPERAAALSAHLRRRLQTIEETLTKAHPQPKTALVLVGRRPLVAAGRGSFIDALMPTLALRNVVTRGTAFPVLDNEALAALRPQIIIDASDTQRDLALPKALKTATVLGVQGDVLLRPGPRLPDALEELGSRIWNTP